MMRKLSDGSVGRSITATNKQLRMLVILGMLFGMLAPLMQPRTAQAAQVTAVTLEGGTGTFTASNGTIYAKSGAALTLQVTTDADTKCVEFDGWPRSDPDL